MTGTMGDPNLNLDLSELIGKIHQQANIASRSGQMEDLQTIAIALTNWQARLRRAFLLALGEPNSTAGWVTVVNQVAQVRHERDGAQRVSTYNAEQLREYDRTFTRLRTELDEARRQDSI
jgi:hypothetical protein